MVVLPLMLEVEQVLDLWLVEVPAHAAAFTVWLLAAALIDSMHHPLYYDVQATGKVKWYNIIVGSSQLLVVILAYVILKCAKVQPELIFRLIFVFSIIAQTLRIIITGKYVEMNIGQYLRRTVLPVALVTIVSPVLPWLVVHYMDPCFGRLCLTVLVSVLAVGIAVLFIGLDSSERKNILKLLNGRKQV